MYVDLAGLARYKSDFGAWARGALLPKDAAAARVRTAKAGAVSFVPVQRTPLDVSVDFLFSETGPASGDKAPDNPSTIAGVDNVLIRRLNKNILSTNKTYPSSSVYNNVTFTYNADKSITINGTASATTQVWLSLGVDKLYLFREITYTLSGFKPSSQTGIRLMIAKGNEYRVINPTTTSATFSPLQSSIYGCFIEINNGTVIDNVTIYPQLELGSTATEYEPFVLDSYIVSLNGTYYGGTLDVATGVLTVTREGVVFDGTENWTLHPDSSGNFIAFVLQPFVPVTSSIYTGGISSSIGNSVICSHFANRTSDREPNSFYIAGKNAARFVVKNNTDLYSDLPTFKTWLSQQYASGTPLSLVCALAVPYTVQLTPTEILSLTQSSGYDPRVNTVYSDASAVQVGYLKHPSAASSDLRNAVVSLGGGV